MVFEIGDLNFSWRKKFQKIRSKLVKQRNFNKFWGDEFFTDSRAPYIFRELIACTLISYEDNLEENFIGRVIQSADIIINSVSGDLGEKRRNIFGQYSLPNNSMRSKSIQN